MVTFAQNVTSTNVNALTLKPYTQVQRGLIANPKTGMIIYQSDGVKGVYSYNGTGWVLDAPGNNSQWIDNAGNLTYSVGNIGIGTATPSSKLHVVGNRIGIESASPTIYMKNTVNGYGINALEFSSNNDVKIANGAILSNAGGGTSTMYVQNNNQNVGIGTITPTAKLEVVGDIKFGSSGTKSLEASIRKFSKNYTITTTALDSMVILQTEHLVLDPVSVVFRPSSGGQAFLPFKINATTKKVVVYFGGKPSGYSGSLTIF